ncbi:hypothetical protein Lesp02_02860 [Lentzea sp. NBRC 105346]|uniref:hypothetical protein n=1 Tax=Lentzea sp. NBRC 105346 TaxID=3032205 RepID=UPI0024A463AB|nr:hypothetical protein [Lentzea sp. NBRC 105346]GLZ28096.1 hypothetical protein Lesp02_02860 [Lentzea sp. NBRC 105346]
MTQQEENDMTGRQFVCGVCNSVTVPDVTENNVRALEAVLTSRQVARVRSIRVGRRFSITFSMPADDAIEMITKHMDRLASAGKKRGFPHQSLHNLVTRLTWVRNELRKE